MTTKKPAKTQMINLTCEKCETPNCTNLADYKINLQRLDLESEIYICENCCENLFCYDEKVEYNPKKET